MYYKMFKLSGFKLSCSTVWGTLNRSRIFTMPETCFAVGCYNRRDRHSKRSFCRIPAEKTRKDRWISAIKRDGWFPTEINTHLRSDCFISASWDRCDHLAPDHGHDDNQQFDTTRKWTATSSTDDGSNGSDEEGDAASKLPRSDLNNLKREKPLFSSGVEHSGACVPLKLCHGSEDSVPYTINRYLRDYQREGIRFIYSNYSHSRGCILGDDMGLGKTVQVLGFLAAALHKKGTWDDIESNKPHFLQSQTPFRQREPDKLFLIVAPLSVLYNWKDELDTWGHFQYAVVHGLRKQEALARVKKGRVEIALTTYETLRLCLTQFNNITWSAVFVDEAHKIKNPNSQITQAMKALKCQIRIGLTGTILQNNLEELWCVMDWAVPGCLGSLGHFRKKVSEPIEQGQGHSATKRALATARKTIRDLVRKISHCFLRRTKTLIKDQLPKKDDRVVYCSLTDFQQTVYQAVLDSEDVQLLLRSSEKCGCQSGRARRRCCYKTNSEGVPVKTMYFTYLAVLRKVASHVALLQSTAGTSKKQEKCVNAICQKVFQKFPDFVQRCKDEAFEALSDPMYSGKMKVLQKLLRFYRQKKDKVLLFSLSTKLLDVLQSYCMAEGHDYSRLDGTTKAKERVNIVKEFNTSTHINLCLVSTMAGGLGLNFVGANVVILFDPTWNPANDLQAIDRAYRIGQCKDVTVFRLISLGTVEEITYLRQVYKQQLQSSVVGAECARRYFDAVQGTHKGELFGIQNLFRLQTQGTCLTRKLLEREGQVEAGVMTTSTHTNVDEEMKTHSVSGAGDASKESMCTPKIPKGLLDFSSGSDDDNVERERVNPSGAVGTRTTDSSVGPRPVSLLQHGFATVLQRLQAMPESSEGDSTSGGEGHDEGESQETNSSSSEGSNTQNNVRPKLGRNMLQHGKTKPGDTSRRKNLEANDKESDRSIKNPMLPKSHRFDHDSEESDDLDIEMLQRAKGDALNSRRRAICKRQGRRGHVGKRDMVRGTIFTEDIETFTSEDGNTGSSDLAKARVPKNGQGSRMSTRRGEDASFTHLKSQTSPASKGTIDTVLGGVQEAVYTHSNQRVVGGSKAEELISKAAVKDVFERNMYSQLPANELLTPFKSLPESPPDRQPRLTPDIPQQLPEPHPVTITESIVQHTRCHTFILGETPLAVRRQQLQEMASKLNFPSAQQFAAEVLRSDSTQRLAWLRSYYATLGHPEFATFVAGNLMPADGAQISPLKTTETERPKSKQKGREPAKKKRLSQKNVHEPQSDVPSVVPEEQEQAVSRVRGHRKTKKSTVARPVGGHGVCEASSSSSCPDPQEMTDTSLNMEQNMTANVKKHSQEVLPQEQNSDLTELLGDTSILDDLLKPKLKGPAPKTSTSVLASPHQSRSANNINNSDTCESFPTKQIQLRRGRKDFWDILNEGNEESIDRLTDLDEVQRACVKTNLGPRTHSVEMGSKSLWKTNDKFLWKK
ncbi:DNA excision repair protein ERCC-6-like 2 isoform X2 [Syngnathoides biaculeatus]|uniref:DNA excision repair protein ERCC-6-like 2 isoform X2 n=1 Tax=Syngnathoides biaculeatus TaxID=300417 RepID=UPI002ADE92EE|nr:DNA excision repair protein ERCC-6-like 2 isoform X2 [Syngnathoides biaculeatus]